MHDGQKILDQLTTFINSYPGKLKRWIEDKLPNIIDMNINNSNRLKITYEHNEDRYKSEVSDARSKEFFMGFLSSFMNVHSPDEKRHQQGQDSIINVIKSTNDQNKEISDEIKTLHEFYIQLENVDAVIYQTPSAYIVTLPEPLEYVTDGSDNIFVNIYKIWRLVAIAILILSGIFYLFSK